MSSSVRTRPAAADAGVVWHAVRLGRGPVEVARGRQAVRRFLVGSCRPAGGVEPLQLADLLVIVSELVTNTIDHTGEHPVLLVARHQGLVHVEVRDCDPCLPQEQLPDHSEPHGRGLALVARLSARHGIRPLPGGGKAVWAELALRERRASPDGQPTSSAGLTNRPGG